MTSYLKLIAKSGSIVGGVPLLVGSSPTVRAFGGTAAVTLPVCKAGDFILIHTGASTDTNATQPTSTGYTVGTGFYVPGSSYRPQLGMLKKTAVTADSGATVTINGNAPGTWVALATVWRNVSGLRTGEQNTNDVGTVVDPLAVTTGHVNDIVGVWTVYRGGTITTGLGGLAGYTTIRDNDGSESFGRSGFYKAAGVVGSVNPPAQTTAVQHAEWSSQTFMIKP